MIGYLLKFISVAMVIVSATVHACGSKTASVCGEEFLLNDVQIGQYSSDALSGDGVKANALWLHYAIARQEPKSGHKWLAIAAENGNPEAQLEYARQHMLSTNPEKVCRASFWAKKALEGGLSDAETEIREAKKKCLALHGEKLSKGS